MSVKGAGTATEVTQLRPLGKIPVLRDGGLGHQALEPAPPRLGLAALLTSQPDTETLIQCGQPKGGHGGPGLTGREAGSAPSSTQQALRHGRTWALPGPELGSALGPDS